MVTIVTPVMFISCCISVCSSIWHHFSNPDYLNVIFCTMDRAMQIMQFHNILVLLVHWCCVSSAHAVVLARPTLNMRIEIYILAKVQTLLSGYQVRTCFCTIPSTYLSHITLSPRICDKRWEVVLIKKESNLHALRNVRA